ncbi:MAG: multidrug ABC transporter ATP-binding protein, partial [Candidatus Nanopelagicaceae bacterium]
EVIFFGKTEELLHRSRPTIVVKTSKKSELKRLKKLVDQVGHPAIIEGDELRVDAEEKWGAELNELAFDNGILLRQLTPVRPTLEETFFSMTEENR